jgi:hypothetical protein
MQTLRRAAVLILLGVSLGIPGAHAATARSEARSQASRSATDRIGTWWNLAMGALAKAGCSINPWGQCQASTSTQAPNTDAGCRIDPWGRCGVSSVRQAPDTDSGCTIDPLGRCLGH